jgi:hypothetical protein
MNQAAESETRSAIRVECYAGYRGDETPVRFHLGARVIEVEDVLDRWLDPAHRYFKVKGDDGGVYILRHDTRTDAWQMTLFDGGKMPGTKLSTT